MEKILILGRESSGTRMVSRFIANCLGIIEKVEDWDGRWEVSNSQYEVIHRSLPHGPRDRFVKPVEFGEPDEVLVVICSRDNNIAYKSAFNLHNKGQENTAQKTDERARETIKQIINENTYEFCFFDYEAAAYLGNTYLDWWASSNLGIENKSNLKVKDGNKKYIT